MNRKEALLNALPVWFCSVVFAIYYYQTFGSSLPPIIIITILFNLFIYYVLRTM